ncbi:putative mitosis protein dim1 [Erysiphe neolycopersici]|uniref:Putative mitosis protein dim1 n=1 Tax=Erysiphe neolycopersici TaxID=212602 RepID=A0A420I4E6_9PEZI|nr:putative mitosis protein dim1 [Erysiphe neolycopersici]
MVERADRKSKKIDAETAHKIDHRAEGLEKGYRRSSRNIGRALSNKIYINQDNLLAMMKTEDHVFVPKTYEDAMYCQDNAEWMTAIDN